MKKNNDNIQNKILETYRTEVKINFPDYINNNNNTDKPKHKYYAVMHFDTELNLNISSQPNVWLNYKNQFFDKGEDAFYNYAIDLNLANMIVEADNVDKLPYSMLDAYNNINDPAWQNEYLYPYLNPYA